MSLSIEFTKNLFKIQKMILPSRYYYFNDKENYIKLVTIGEGIFPADKIKTYFKLSSSSLIITSESANKVYPSTKEYGLTYLNIKLKESNLEFINDELILFKDSKLIQLLRFDLDDSSTFFYTDILSNGRSFEDFTFSKMLTRNKFYINKELEYYENFEVEGADIKDYLKRRKSQNTIFAKVYIKSERNGYFLDSLTENNFDSFTYTKSKKMIIGVLSHNNMNTLKKKVKEVWDLYRKAQNKEDFDLGKL